MPESLLAWMTLRATPASDSSPCGEVTNKAASEHIRQHEAAASVGRECGRKRR